MTSEMEKNKVKVPKSFHFSDLGIQYFHGHVSLLFCSKSLMNRDYQPTNCTDIAKEQGLI